MRDYCQTCANRSRALSYGIHLVAGKHHHNYIFHDFKVVSSLTFPCYVFVALYRQVVVMFYRAMFSCRFVAFCRNVFVIFECYVLCYAFVKFSTYSILPDGNTRQTLSQHFRGQLTIRSMTTNVGHALDVYACSTN